MAPITPTQLPESSRIKANGSGFITNGLKKTTYVALINERDELTKQLGDASTQVCEANQTNLGLTKQSQELRKSNQDNIKELDTQRRLVGQLNERLSEKNNEIKDLTTQNTNQQDEITKLQGALAAAVQSLKDAGKHSKSEQSKDTKAKVWANIKERHYRTIKFVREQELTDLTRTVYSEIKDNITDDEGQPMSESEFIRIYESYVQDSLSGRRQYTQTQLQDAMVGKFLKHV